jgi:2'-deoxynucleoside 5'-phosphate N-hydrolase
VNIYLACTVRGDRCAIDSTRALAATVESLGHTVLTSHLLSDDVELAESKLREAEVFERDLAWLAQADVLIAEASGSSFGVGFEVGYFLAIAKGTGRRVLLAYDATRRDKVSRLIVGNSHPNCTTYAYRDAGDLRQAVRTFLQARSH